MRIIIAGTGGIAEEFEKYVCDNVIIVGYVETNPQKATYNKKNVYRYSDLPKVNFDLIVVANIYSEEIKIEISKNYIDSKKVIYLRPWTKIGYEEGKELFNWGELEAIAPRYIEEKLNGINRYFIANKMWLDDIKGTVLERYKVQQRDYFRYRTFELIADQIAPLSGNVAEVGVFQGEFAQIINEKFSNRKFYLFDTFESFDKNEFSKEYEMGNCKEDFDKVFTYTSVQKVLNRMPYPEQCIVRKGLFPTTAEGIDEKFVFASIDVDFEKSIYECIKWFYPRMVEGGVIFIHDYNNKQLFGVKKAVEQFEKENGNMNKIPIGDWGGTLIILK